jgi:hypothetical protein
VNGAGMPPVAVNGLVMTGVCAAIVIISGELPAPAVLDAVIVALNVPNAVGTPEISPELALTLKPGGKPTAANAFGWLFAVI